MTKFKVGDKVKVINPGSCYSTYIGWIDRYAKKYKKNWKHNRSITDTKSIYEVKVIHSHDCFKDNIYLIQNTTNQEVYIVGKRGIEKEVKNSFTIADLKNGDIVTYKDGTKRIIENNEIYDLFGIFQNNFSSYDKNLNNLVVPDFNIVKVERPQVVYERKEEILDKVERKYLSGVIRPFRNEVKYIIKERCFNNDEYITIELNDGEQIDFPSFSSNTMYKGMKVDKNYTLDELGL